MYLFYIPKSVIYFLLRSEIRTLMASTTKTSGCGFYHVPFRVGGIKTEAFRVCKNIFASAHRRGKSHVNMLIREIKNNIVSSKKEFNDRTNNIIDEIRNDSRSGVVELSSETFGNTLLTNSKTHFALVAWLDLHFKESCDQVPNRYGNLELEQCDKKAIYLMYKRDMEERDCAAKCVGITTFYEVWRDIFDHVKTK